MKLLDRETFEAAIPVLLALYQRAFQRPMREETLRWRYLANPIGDVLTAVETDDKDRIVASYSASPCRMKFQGRMMLTALSLDTMTAPEHSGKGLFTALASALYDHMKNLGYEVVWGFPNFRSHPGFIAKLGWRDIYEIPTMRLELASAKMSDVVDVSFVRDDNFTLNYEVADLVSDSLSVVRDTSYLRWRYTQNPRHRYEVFARPRLGCASCFAVIKEYEKGLDIVDVRASSRDEVLELLSHLARVAQERQLETLSIWAPRHHFLHSACERMGFRLREPITYLGARFLGSDDTLSCSASNWSNWFLQMGDSDVY